LRRWEKGVKDVVYMPIFVKAHTRTINTKIGTAILSREIGKPQGISGVYMTVFVEHVPITYQY
jgi:hypothetical protein